MPKLSDTQMIILASACSRPDRTVLPLPKSLKGGAAAKVIDSLIAKGLVQEVDANAINGDPVWRETGDGHGVTLVATETADAEPAVAAQRPAKAKKAKVAPKAPPKAKKPTKSATTPAMAKNREGTKQAQLIAMLKRAKGATIAEIADAFSW